MNVPSGYRPDTRSARLRAFASTILSLFLGFLLSGSCAHASVALLLEQPYGKLDIIDPAGHSAIYLDHVCAETPLKLRPCRPGELGVVISRYARIGNHDWIAMPLIPYLYSVDSVAKIPQTIDRTSEERLRNAYRQQYLQTIAPDIPDGSAPAGSWYELVGSAYDRTIYGFSVNTTSKQDARLIATFNDHRNIADYDGAFRNCADFARVTLNMFYPHAVRRNYVADLGITTPKSVARSLSHYAAKHHRTGFSVFIIPQVKGDLPRSHSNTGVAEGVLKCYGLPLTVMSPVSTALVFVAYLGHGRFAMPKDPPLLSLSDPPKSSPTLTLKPASHSISTELEPPNLKLPALKSAQSLTASLAIAAPISPNPSALVR